MPSLKSIRKRISSVKNTQKITKAMKMVAAAKLRRAQDAALALRPYAQHLNQIASDVAERFLAEPQVEDLVSAPSGGSAAEGAAEGGTDPKRLIQKILLGQNESRIRLVVVSADRGLAGAYNSGLFRRCERFFVDQQGLASPPTIDLIDDRCLYVTAPMDEVDAPKIKVGQEARITLDAMPDKIFPGRIRRIASYVTEIEKQARTVDIEVDFLQTPADVLLVGYSADIEVILQRKDDVLRIPTQAIRQNNKVWLVDSHSRLVEQSVETGLSNWSFTEVRSGLKAGDRVLIAFDKEGIKAGAAVQPKTQ